MRGSLDILQGHSDAAQQHHDVTLVAVGLAPAAVATLLSSTAPSSTQPANPATAPTLGNPAAGPALPIRPATPRDALKIFALAMRDGDGEKLRAVVMTASESEARMLTAIAEFAGALTR